MSGLVPGKIGRPFHSRVPGASTETHCGCGRTDTTRAQAEHPTGMDPLEYKTTKQFRLKLREKWNL